PTLQFAPESGTTQDRQRLRPLQQQQQAYLFNYIIVSSMTDLYSLQTGSSGKTTSSGEGGSMRAEQHGDKAKLWGYVAWTSTRGARMAAPAAAALAAATRDDSRRRYDDDDGCLADDVIFERHRLKHLDSRLHDEDVEGGHLQRQEKRAETSRTMMCRVSQFIFQPGIIPHITEVRIEKQWVEARKPNWIERLNRNRFSFLSTPMVHGCTISVSVHPKWASLLALRLRCSTLDAKKRIDLTGDRKRRKNPTPVWGVNNGEPAADSRILGVSFGQNRNDVNLVKHLRWGTGTMQIDQLEVTEQKCGLDMQDAILELCRTHRVRRLFIGSHSFNVRRFGDFVLQLTGLGVTLDLYEYGSIYFGHLSNFGKLQLFWDKTTAVLSAQEVTLTMVVRTETDEANFDYDKIRAHIRCERTSDSN
ncbi:hypothetical protein PRIPAC_70372, partial [Pristionchus pacificus]|uniref:Uncharacterized protein n=1 Tax=Pristionchus pacificus TaxID=54126 RepID=A0A2A6CGC4_PRIPA